MPTDQNLDTLVLHKLCEKYSLQRAASHAKALVQLNMSLKNNDYKEAQLALQKLSTECEFIDSYDTNFLDPLEALCLKADPVVAPDEWMNFFFQCLEKGFFERLHKMAHIVLIDYFSAAFQILVKNFRQSDQARDGIITLIASESIQSPDLDDVQTRSRLEVMYEICPSWKPSLQLVKGVISNGKHETLVWLLSTSGYRKGDECIHEFVALAVQAGHDEMACLLIETGFPYTHAVFNDVKSRPEMVRTHALMTNLAMDANTRGLARHSRKEDGLTIDRTRTL